MTSKGKHNLQALLGLPEVSTTPGAFLTFELLRLNGKGNRKMNKKSNELVAIVLVTTMLLVVLPTIRAQPSNTVPAPCVYLVGPSGSGNETFYSDIMRVGSTFNVTAWINTTSDETGWEGAFFFNSSQLKVVSLAYTYGQVGDWFFDQGVPCSRGAPSYNNIAGTIGEPGGFSELATEATVLHASVGTLLTITFEVMMVPPAGTGNYLTSEVDWDMGLACMFNPTGLPDPNASFGNFTYTLANPPQGVAVTSVATHKTVASQGYGVNVTLTAANLDVYTETFNVTAYANTTIFASQNVTLLSGTSENVTFTWNTTGFAYGNYTISAYAWPAPGETSTAFNNCTGGWVCVSIVGDVNGDGIVNMKDIALVARAFGSTPSSNNWNPNADINGDGMVNMRDIALVARNLGQHYP